MYVRQRGTRNGSPVWSLRFERKDPGTGKRTYVYETFHGSNREAKRHWQTRWGEIDRLGAGYVKPEKKPLAEYLQGWLRDYGQNLKPTTLASYTSLANTHVIPALGAVALSDLTAKDVQDWEADMLRKPSGRGKTKERPRAAPCRLSAS